MPRNSSRLVRTRTGRGATMPVSSPDAFCSCSSATPFALPLPPAPGQTRSRPAGRGISGHAPMTGQDPRPPAGDTPGGWLDRREPARKTSAYLDMGSTIWIPGGASRHTVSACGEEGALDDMDTPLRFGTFIGPLHDPAHNPTLAIRRNLELV